MRKMLSVCAPDPSPPLKEKDENSLVALRPPSLGEKDEKSLVALPSPPLRERDENSFVAHH